MYASIPDSVTCDALGTHRGVSVLDAVVIPREIRKVYPQVIHHDIPWQRALSRRFHDCVVPHYHDAPAAIAHAGRHRRPLAIPLGETSPVPTGQRRPSLMVRASSREPLSMPFLQHIHGLRKDYSLPATHPPPDLTTPVPCGNRN